MFLRSVRRASAWACFAAIASAQEVSGPSSTETQSGQLEELSLEELMGVDVVVTSASLHEQPLSLTPAAIYVITAEDIERSGATSLPEALRLAPGVEVARIDSSRWAVSIRGFNNLYANKLLVLVDGRSIYTSLFSGVFWDAHDLPLEEIERIEVIRGPGGAVWGANAVNGIINVITRSATQTAGARVTTTAGDFDRLITYGRVGDADESGGWRAWARYSDRGETRALGGGDGEDDWSVWRAGYRADRVLSERDRLTFAAEFYEGDVRSIYSTAAPPPQYVLTAPTDSEIRGGSAQSRWERNFAERDQLSIAGYVDYSDRVTDFFSQERTSFGFDVQRRQPLARGHDFTYGASLRMAYANSGESDVFGFRDGHRVDARTSVFAQDSITLAPDRWELTLGLKVEHEDLTGVNSQPSARLLYTPSERHTWWFAVSRALRTPSQVEQDVELVAAIVPGVPDQYFTYIGDRDVSPETLDAIELGYRVKPNERLSFDAAAFFNLYEDLIEFEPGAPFFSGGQLVVPLIAENRVEAESHGFELSAEWLPRDDTRLSAAWSYLDLEVDSHGSANPDAESDEGASPSHRVRLRVQHDFDTRWRADLTGWRVERLETGDVPAYWRLDARLERRLGDNGSLAFAVQNLFHDDDSEFADGVLGPANDVVTAFHVRLAWSF